MKKANLATALATASLVVTSLAFGASVAGADVGAGLVGNTVTLTSSDGAETQIYYADGSKIVIKTSEGAEIPGTWRVEGNTICTSAGDAPESCTAPIDEAPIVGSAGSIEGEAGSVAWAVSAGRDF
ncbi:MAG: hypothetical protein RLN89_02785 [Parvibaculum sp.]